MKILITGAKGMVGQALCANLKNIRDGKNRTRPNIKIEEIYEYDIDSTPEELEEYCALIRDCLEILPDDIVIHRLTGDGPKKLLIAPKWSADKKRVLNTLRKWI